MDWLKNPVTMIGTITKCWLFTYQTSITDAGKLLPKELEPVTFNQRAFWNVVVCHVRGMRPKPLPEFVGVDYWHVAYRLYARFHPAEGAPIEGLFFLRSDCDNSLMSMAGNLVTDFNFHTADIELKTHGHDLDIEIASPDAPATARICSARAAQLPSHSAFQSLTEASEKLKYVPNGIGINSDGSANIVKIVRQESDWRSRLVHVERADWSFFHDKDIRPEICYQVEPIFYQWNRGRNYRAAVKS